MKTLRIVEKFDMVVDWKVGDPESYLFWAHEQPTKMSKPFTSSWLSLKALNDYLGPDVIHSAVELAAGVGAQSLMIQELFAPDIHLIQDLHQESIDHIETLVQLGELPDIVELRAMDAFDTNALVRADLIQVDMGDFNSMRLREGERYLELLDRIFRLSPTAVGWTDLAGMRIGLHRGRYESVLGEGTCVSYRSYLEALTGFFEHRWGYRAVEVLHTGHFAKMAFVPMDPLLETAFTVVPNSPIGCQVLG